MAKKKSAKEPKDGYSEMTLEELEVALENEVDKEAKKIIESEIKAKKRYNKKGAQLEKMFPKKNQFDDIINFKQVEMKPQDYINMSDAFKEVLKQPGIPKGHTTMVYGLSDVGKTTMAVELAVNAQNQGVFPVLIITENKFSTTRAETMGLDPEYCHIHNDVDHIEEGCEIIEKYLKLQENGEVSMDLVFIWDSIGQTQSRAEHNAVEAGEGSGGMMTTARVLSERVKRHICTKINKSRRADYPYTNTLFFVNHAYTKPPTPPSRISTIVPYGGEAIWLAASFVIRMGGVQSRSAKVSATKDKTTISFAIKSAIKLEKNHINNVSAQGRIVCTDHGFLIDDKKAIDDYKKAFRDDWDLDYERHWDNVSLE